MANKISEIFSPSPQSRIKQLELFCKLHYEQIGECSTCVHHIPSALPGFVSDYGECSKNVSFFPEKVCSLTEIECLDYQENIDAIRNFEHQIQDLRNL